MPVLVSRREAAALARRNVGKAFLIRLPSSTCPGFSACFGSSGRIRLRLALKPENIETTYATDNKKNTSADFHIQGRLGQNSNDRQPQTLAPTSIPGGCDSANPVPGDARTFTPRRLL